MSSTYQGNHWYRHTKYLFIHWSKIMASNKIDERVNCCSGHSHSKTQQTAFHTGYRVTELMQKHQKHRKKKIPFPSKAKGIQRQFCRSVSDAHIYLVSFTGGRMESGKETMVATSLLQHIWAWKYGIRIGKLEGIKPLPTLQKSLCTQ